MIYSKLDPSDPDYLFLRRALLATMAGGVLIMFFVITHVLMLVPAAAVAMIYAAVCAWQAVRVRRTVPGLVLLLVSTAFSIVLAVSTVLFIIATSGTPAG